MLKTLNFDKNNLKKDREYWLGLGFVLISAVIYSALFCNKTMPYAEGWYTYYAQLINEGNVVYRDFEYLFMPGYITFIALFTKIFGYKIMALRILGVAFYTGIAYFAYKIFNEIFSQIAACFGALVTIFYLQSEVVQIFYDYIRMMDLFAYATIFLLIKISKNYIDGKNKNYILCAVAGACNAMVLMIKQNIGLLFGFYVLCFFIFLFLYFKEKKNVLLNLVLYGVGAGVIFSGYGIYLLANNALKACLRQTLFGATEAKGGIISILFKWIIDGWSSFVNEKFIIFTVVIVVAVLLWLNKSFAYSDNQKSGKIIFIIFGVLTPIILLGLYKFDKITQVAADRYESHMYSYGFFAVIVISFFILGIMYLSELFSKNKKFNHYISVFLLLGAIFAIGYGVGMSGSLAQSQIALSVGIIIALFVSLCQGKFKCLSMSLVTILSLCIIVCCSAFKMANTYSWWGMTDSSIWEATETMDIDIFDGIKVSPEEKEIYESIDSIVQENSDEEDAIFTFPHIPIVYSATNRFDPGTFTKVQWYDVSTNKEVEKDISVVQEKAPKIIVLYNIPKFAIKGHEESFNKNQKSATTKMFEKIRKYCINNGYMAVKCGRINKNCSITVWVKNDDKPNWYSSGSGTKEDPYIISTTNEFINFGKMVNGGASFANVYIQLKNDIDMKNVKDFEMIGDETKGTVFAGFFNGNGYAIKNLNMLKSQDVIKTKDGKKIKNDIALFGYSTGKIYNLGLENCHFTGFCLGGIVRYGDTKKASIVNCYVKNCRFKANYRSGSIADDYQGVVYNCISINTELTAKKKIGTVANRDKALQVFNCTSDANYYNDMADLILPSEINSKKTAERLNINKQGYNNYAKYSSLYQLELNDWQIADGELVLTHR